MHITRYKGFAGLFVVRIQVTKNRSFFTSKITVGVQLFLLATISIILSFSLRSENLQLTTPLKFQQLSVKDGLSQNYVYSITQDTDGFVWIATQDGLNRYDGYEFKYYRHNLSSKTSIADNFIRKVFVDKQNNLWVGTQNGLSRYNRDVDSFFSYKHDANDVSTLSDNIIWDIYQDHLGSIWVSTELGIHKYNSENDSFSRVRIRGVTDKLKEVRTIFQDNLGNYWLGTYEQGIFVANNTFSFATSLENNSKLNVSIDAQVLYDMKEINNRYWLATEQGVYVIGKDFSVEQQFTIENGLLSNTVRAISKQSNDLIWLGTSNGISTIRGLDNYVSNYQSSSHHMSLSDNQVMDMFVSSNGTLWIGTLKGLSQFSPLSTAFKHQLYDFNNQHISVEVMTKTPDDKLWFASVERGLNYINNDLVTNVPFELGKEIVQLKSDDIGTLWLVTTNNELIKYSPDTGSYAKISQWHKQSDFNAFTELTIINDFIWFLDNSGQLKSFNLSNYEFTTHTRAREQVLMGLYNQENNYIWSTTGSNELIKFSILDGKQKKYTVAENSEFSFLSVNNIHVSNNYVWLSSLSQGIALVNLTNLKSSVFNENSGLTNNFINACIIDQNSAAWCSTNKGINFIDPHTLQSQAFYSDFALSDIEFISHSSLKYSNDSFFFGGLNGIVEFNPLTLKALNTKIPPPSFNKLLIANKPVSIEDQPVDVKDKFTLSKSLNTLATLTLKHAQSPFSIEFSSPNADLPEQLGYKYRLNGLEDHWIDSGENNRRATYTNLSAGEYVFELQAYDIYHPENYKTRRLTVKILPPWWLSNIAKAAYTLLSLLVIGYFVQQYRYKRQYNLQIKLSEERLKLSLWGSGDEMWDWNITSGKIYRSNIWGTLDFPQDGKRSNKVEYSNIHPQDIKRVQSALKHHFDDDCKHFEATYRVQDKTNQWVWILDRGKIVDRDDDNKPTRMTGTLKDISHIKKAEERLKLFAKCIESISDAVVIYDRQFTIVDINQAFSRITGKSKKQMFGTPMHFAQYSDIFNQSIKKNVIKNGSWHGEIENRRENGEVFLTELSLDIIKDDAGSISHFVGVFSDITKRKETEAELRKLANSDTLTGLPNRSYFQANQLRLVKNKVPHALLVFDLDNFKKINDSLGHEAGDVLLCKVAERILNIGRQQDTVYRLGGDEFSLVIENTNDIHTITSIAKEILAAIAQPLRIKNQELVLYSSIGIVLYPEDGVSPQELLKNADTAMYHAKNLGGNRYQFFSESMNKQAVQRLQVENLIRHGLKGDFFSVFYQPKINIASGKVSGMEALVRFDMPNKGVISPSVFIPVSEETGQIIDIGEVVLRKACFATKKWVDAGLFDGRMAVNLSAVQFTQPNLVSVIESALTESQLPAKYLELEITEGTVMDSPQKAIETMLQIRAMGINLSLDDFGTGYSSLAYLKRFPLNTLKIDKAFVDDIEHSEQGRNMVATIVTIAHNLGLNVVAEGVETNQQLQYLASLRCEQLQGYLYSKPLPEKDFHNYLLSHRITDKSTAFKKSR